MNNKIDELRDAAQDARRALDRERERVMERAGQIDGFARTLDAVYELLDENEKLRDEYELLRQQVQEEKEQRTRVEIQLNEMSKLSASVAGKASHDELLKALRVFVNKSKRKKLEKRIAVKEMVLELAYANGIVFPEDLAQTLDSLDDEQTEPKVKMENVTFQGAMYDVNGNSEVRIGGTYE